MNRAAAATRLATAVRLGRTPGLIEATRGRCMVCRSLDKTRRFALAMAECCSVPLCIGCVARTWRATR